MWVYDVNTLKFLTVNKAAVKKYGYTEEEFRGMTPLEKLLARSSPYALYPGRDPRLQ